MSRRQKCRLRELTPEERAQLERISRARTVPASHVARAKVLLAVAAQHSYTAAARQAGRRSGDAVAMRVARFNREGMAAVFPRPGGGRPARYTVADRERLLAEARRVPDRERDGTARRCGRRGPCGAPCARTVYPRSAPQRSGRCSGEPD